MKTKITFMLVLMTSSYIVNAQLTNDQKIQMLQIAKQSTVVIEKAMENNYSIPEIDQTNKLKEAGIKDDIIIHVLTNRIKLTSEDIFTLKEYQSKNYSDTIIKKSLEDKPKFDIKNQKSKTEKNDNNDKKISPFLSLHGGISTPQFDFKNRYEYAKQGTSMGIMFIMPYKNSQWGIASSIGRNYNPVDEAAGLSDMQNVNGSSLNKYSKSAWEYYSFLFGTALATSSGKISTVLRLTTGLIWGTTGYEYQYWSSSAGSYYSFDNTYDSKVSFFPNFNLGLIANYSFSKRIIGMFNADFLLGKYSYNWIGKMDGTFQTPSTDYGSNADFIYSMDLTIGIGYKF